MCMTQSKCVEQSKPKCPRLQSFTVNPEFLEKPVILFFIKKHCWNILYQ